MKVLFWNCQGIANPSIQRALWDLVNRHKASIVCLAELKCLFSSIRPSFFVSLGYSLATINEVNDRRVPSIWVLVSTNIVSFNIISFHSYHVTTSFLVDGTLMYGSFIYGSTSRVNRRALWNSLFDLSIQCPWFTIGDYNAILGAHELREICLHLLV